MPLSPTLVAALACAQAAAVVDRVEGRFAVLETAEEALVDVPIALFPVEPREGDRVLLAACRTAEPTAAEPDPPSRVEPFAGVPHGADSLAPDAAETQGRRPVGAPSQPGGSPPIGDRP